MEKNQKRFSIAIVSYNVEKYIERAINSVIEQDFGDYEILVVDDCSTDKTMEIVKGIKNDNIRILTTNKNTGTAGGPRNVAIDNAIGEYIIFLDGDDTLYNDKVLSKIDEVLGNEQVDILFLGYENVGNGNTERTSTEENSTKEARLICDETFSVSSRCWNREFLVDNDIKFKEGLFYEDEIYCLKTTILAQRTKSANIKVFKYYRNRKGSVMSAPTIKKCSDWYRMLAEVTDLYEITPKEYKPYLLSFIRNENDSIPQRIDTILKAIESGKSVQAIPKRNYKFRRFYEDEDENISG